MDRVEVSMSLTSNQKNILHRMLYEGLVIIYDYKRLFLAEPYTLNKQGDIPLRTLRALNKKGAVRFSEMRKNENYYGRYDIVWGGIREVANLRIVEKAKKAIEGKANEYKPKEYVYFLIFVDENGDFIEELKTDFWNVVCEDCIADAVEKYRQEWKSGRISCEEKGATDIDYDEETCGEYEDFVYCMECGEIIDYSMILTGQELDYWLDEREPGDYVPQDCYMLLKIFNCHTFDPELTPRIEDLARRVVTKKEKKR
jgi:hypothetical protein